jgi:hypothetical protein
MIAPKQGMERIGRRLKLRDLRILMTVVECGTMGKAAGRLAVSQPVVSKAIAESNFCPTLQRAKCGSERPIRSMPRSWRPSSTGSRGNIRG